MSSYSRLSIHTVKVLCYRYFFPSKCVDTNTIIAPGASGALLAPAWLAHSKDGESRQGCGAFISPLGRLPLALLFLVYDGSYQLCLQAVFHILVHAYVRQTVFVIECPYTIKHRGHNRNKRLIIIIIFPAIIVKYRKFFPCLIVSQLTLHHFQDKCFSGSPSSI